MGRASRFGLLFCLLACPMSVRPSASADFSLEEWRAKVGAEQDINGLARLYVEYRLEADPTFGHAIGIHGKEGRPRDFDSRLPDVSTAAWVERYETHLFMRTRLAGIDSAALSRADRVDHHIVRNEVEQQILQMAELGTITNPLTYVGTLGNAFTGLMLRDYAPLEERLQSFGERCGATARFLDQARLALSPPRSPHGAAEAGRARPPARHGARRRAVRQVAAGAAREGEPRWRAIAGHRRRLSGGVYRGERVRRVDGAGSGAAPRRRVAARARPLRAQVRDRDGPPARTRRAAEEGRRGARARARRGGCGGPAHSRPVSRRRDRGRPDEEGRGHSRTRRSSPTSSAASRKTVRPPEA